MEIYSYKSDNIYQFKRFSIFSLSPTRSERQKHALRSQIGIPRVQSRASYLSRDGLLHKSVIISSSSTHFEPRQVHVFTSSIPILGLDSNSIGKEDRLKNGCISTNLEVVPTDFTHLTVHSGWYLRARLADENRLGVSCALILMLNSVSCRPYPNLFVKLM